MAEQKCKGCQSFCMRGAQLASQAPGQSTDKSYSSIGETKKGSYPTSWANWLNICGSNQGGSKATIIASDSGLSATNQKNFAQFLKDTYEEGEYNIYNYNEWLNIDKQKERAKNIPAASGKPSYTSCSSDMNTATSQVCSGEIVYAKHYNYLLPPLSGNQYNSVSTDSLGNNVSNFISSGYVAGFGGEKGKKTGGQNGDLILAQDYINLASKAKKLLYHPYQCNLCNICEGSEWMEVVKETKKVHGIACGATSKPYNQRGWVNISVNGLNFSSRQDCSGFVSACLYAFNPDVIPANAPSSWSTYVMGPGNSNIAAAGFKWVNGDQGSQEGDIQMAIQSHTQIVSEISGKVYNCGGDESAKNTGPTTPSSHVYDGVWRLDSNSVGGFGNNRSVDQNNFQNGTDPGDNPSQEYIPEPLILNNTQTRGDFGGGDFITIWFEGNLSENNSPMIAIYNHLTNSFLDSAVDKCVINGDVRVFWITDANGSHPSYIMIGKSSIIFTKYNITISNQGNNEVHAECGLTIKEIQKLIHPTPTFEEDGQITVLQLQSLNMNTGEYLHWATQIYKPLCAKYGLKYPGILAAQPFYEVSANFPNTLSNVSRIDNNLGGLKYGGGRIPYSTRGLKVPSNETGGNYCHFTSIGNYFYAHAWNIGHEGSLYSAAKNNQRTVENFTTSLLTTWIGNGAISGPRQILLNLYYKYNLSQYNN